MQRQGKTQTSFYGRFRDRLIDIGAERDIQDYDEYLERQELERASMAKTAAKKTAKADDDTPVKQKRSKPKAAAK